MRCQWAAFGSPDWEGQENDVLPTKYSSKHPEERRVRARIDSGINRDIFGDCVECVEKVDKIFS
jgi:hypothetical protein